MAARRARNEAAMAGMAVMAPLPPGGDDSESANDALKAGASTPSADDAFSVARLQDRLRDLQQELGSLENSNIPDALKATQIHNLSSRINRARQDITGLMQRTQR